MTGEPTDKPLPYGLSREEPALFADGEGGLADASESPDAARGSIAGQDGLAVATFRPWSGLLAVALVLAVFLVYQPAWQGGPIWDDDAHITRLELRSWHGLYRIWFDVGATLQYYPLVHSVFWVEHALWGDKTLGYHLVNLSLHATSALLVALILRRLAIPGAWLAAAIFALHPLQVESVAWISELKNTLSGVFYLGAALLYLRFDRAPCAHGRRKAAWYLAALALFSMALTSKTVTGTLPGALLVIFWWQRGRLSWKKDVLPLVPFFLLGAGMGMITAWWELKINNCAGPEFEFTPAQRILIAARGVWFQLGHLLWPANLTFIYPRWKIDPAEWRQYWYPLAAAALLALLWAFRKRSRAPLAAVLVFGGTLFPVMGFFNLYTFRYSFIADHYQYLAGLGIITLFSASLALLLQHAQGWIKPIGWLGCAALLAVLAVLSWSQSQMYVNLETLYRTTIARNPDCWLAEYNLAEALSGRGQVDEAIAHYRRAVAIKPDHVGAYNNLGLALFGLGQVDAAIAQYRKVLEIQPDHAEAHNNLGVALARLGDDDGAMDQYRKALEIKPDYAEAHHNLGNALIRRGRIEDAIVQFQQAVQIKPDYAEAHNNLGVLLADRGRPGTRAGGGDRTFPKGPRIGHRPQRQRDGRPPSRPDPAPPARK